MRVSGFRNLVPVMSEGSQVPGQSAVTFLLESETTLLWEGGTVPLLTSQGLARLKAGMLEDWHDN